MMRNIHKIELEKILIAMRQFKNKKILSTHGINIDCIKQDHACATNDNIIKFN
jgi:hypothetical protein